MKAHLNTYLILPCRTAKQTPLPPPPPPIFPSWAPFSQGKEISGIASTTDSVRKPQLIVYLLNKQTQFRINRDPSRKFALAFNRKPIVQYNIQTVPWCQKSVLFLTKKIQILNKRSRLWTKEDKLVKLHTGHIFIRYRIKIYSLPLLRISG